MPRDDAPDAALDPRTMTPEWYARETRLAHMLPYVSLVDDQTVRTRVNPTLLPRETRASRPRRAAS